MLTIYKYTSPLIPPQNDCGNYSYAGLVKETAKSTLNSRDCYKYTDQQETHSGWILLLKS